MTKRIKHNLTVTLVHSILCYIILIPFELWIVGISISLLFGFVISMLNDIIIQLRRLNGEKTLYDEPDTENPDELIKS